METYNVKADTQHNETLFWFVFSGSFLKIIIHPNPCVTNVASMWNRIVFWLHPVVCLWLTRANIATVVGGHARCYVHTNSR